MSEYEKYQLQWMIEHGFSLSDLIEELTEYQYSDPEDSDAISRPIEDTYRYWEVDRGFGGNIWACEDEWKETEGI